MIEAVMVFRDKNGWHAQDKLLQYGLPMHVDKAKRRVIAGGTVFVRREDVEAVLWEARGSSGEASKV
jgi:hypothetical protein